ncbi:MAG: 2-phosphosulfolactate phosphatase [Anaerolineae bacterium]|nr:2-phosphosulfolactate phosphatase [Phycisphaerae bacterium]
MQVEVVNLPCDLKPKHVRDRAVVVLDVLRATTTMIAALRAGATEIRIFESLDAARTAARGVADRAILCGEERCQKPSDFDLGNSPADFAREEIAGRTLFMSTTNGTRAIVAARGAPIVVVGALINATSIANALALSRRDVTLLCAGTDGAFSIEDFIGAGAIIHRLADASLSATARSSLANYLDAKNNLREALRAGPGGRNVMAAGLEADIDFAANIDSIEFVGRVHANPLTVRRHDPGDAV